MVILTLRRPGVERNATFFKIAEFLAEIEMRQTGGLDWKRPILIDVILLVVPNVSVPTDLVGNSQIKPGKSATNTVFPFSPARN